MPQAELFESAPPSPGAALYLHWPSPPISPLQSPSLVSSVYGPPMGTPLAFTRYCHYPYDMVYIAITGVGGKQYSAQ